jgi:signal transduction histidine kinase
VLSRGRPERIDSGAAPSPLPGQLETAETSLLVPLVFRGRGLGVIIAYDRLIEGPDFRQEDEVLLSAFAASGATAVHTARSVAAESLNNALEAAEEERRRWARELHDETLQGLGGLHALLASALSTGDPARIEAAVREAMDHTKGEIQSLRSLITELRPAALDELGLEPALASLAEHTRMLQGVEVEMAIEVGEGRLPPELESTIYRLVQESLTNAAKHAEASGVTIRISADAGAVTVVVSDDGKGFDSAQRTAGFGLRGMRERLELLGGRVEIESAPDRGTTVTATIPL